jgi:lipopolysaccharide biosynthesis glycosyltransferase
MIKIFIGSSARDVKAEVALEYTIQKYTSEPVDITWMRSSDNESSVFYNWIQLGTGFSGFRWAVPELCNFTGKALYLDVDMLNFKDIAELYYSDMEDYAMLCVRKETSVTLFNCELMQNFLPPIAVLKTISDIHKYIFSTDSTSHIPLSKIGSLDPRWNVFNGKGFDITDTWILHYTDANSQPWADVSTQRSWRPHPRFDLNQLWYEIYNEAIALQNNCN